MNVANDILITAECEREHGWDYDVRVQAFGCETTHRVRLDWVDHEHWAGGTCRPSRVVQAALRILVESNVALPALFDVSVARRLLAGFDSAMHDRLGEPARAED